MNRTIAKYDRRLRLGGMKFNGMGREGGTEGSLDVLDVKLVQATI